MDRNISVHIVSLSNKVALRKESVDRNIKVCPVILFRVKSLSARRAWIEILSDGMENLS